MKQFYEWFFLETGRTGDPLFSWPHLVSVTVGLVIMLGLAILLGIKLRNSKKGQFVTLLVAGIFIFLVEVAKLFFLVWEYGMDHPWQTIFGNFPLYLCDLPIYILPLCAITKGRFRNWCLDFMAIWGILMGLFGNYFAGGVYPAHAAVSYLSFINILNHCTSLFGATFIWITGLNKMEKRDIPFTITILLIFMSAALAADWLDNHNFMFFQHGDGTPYDFFKNYLSFGKIWVYDLWIYVLQSGYMMLVYLVYYGIMKGINKSKAKKALVDEEQTEVEETQDETTTKEETPIEEQKVEEKPIESQNEEQPKVEEKKEEPKVKKATPKKQEAPAVKKADTTAAPKKNTTRMYHVVKRSDGKWEVKYAGGKKAIKLFRTQKEAIEYSKVMAENQGGAMLVHNSKGANKGRIKKS